ncbi:MAG: MBL fold metallo-hydrolase [Bacteroidia bacterium]
MELEIFTFNPFEENTYVLYDETQQCIIIDPGCYDADERNELTNFIESKNLKPAALLNTHCHIDHVLGNKFVADQYKLMLQIPDGELETLHATTLYGPTMGIYMVASPEPSHLLKDHELIKFGNTQLQCISAPGHSPASICFYNENDKILIGGDVLFYRSIGRTDLPGGNHAQLLASIRTRLFVLPDNVKVFPGHGLETSIGAEKKQNPFVGLAS